MHLVTTAHRAAGAALTLATTLLLTVGGLLVLTSATASAASVAVRPVASVLAGSSAPGVGGSNPDLTESTPARGAAAPHGMDAFMAVVSEHGITGIELLAVLAAAALVLPCLVYLALGSVTGRRRA